MSIINLVNVTKIFDNKFNKIEVLKSFNLQVEKGELIAITGPSGSGKTTLLNILGLLDMQSKGEYYLNGIKVSDMNDIELSRYRNKIGFVAQNPFMLDYCSVYDNIKIPLEYNNMTKSEKKKRIKEILNMLEIIDKFYKYPKELSQGEKQCVAIARALINSPEILLVDEPTCNMDSNSGQKIMDLFIEFNKKGQTIIIVTHDENIAKRCNRIVEL